jgi:hypothetical protein
MIKCLEPPETQRAWPAEDTGGHFLSSDSIGVLKGIASRLSGMEQPAR